VLSPKYLHHLLANSSGTPLTPRRQYDFNPAILLSPGFGEVGGQWMIEAIAAGHQPLRLDTGFIR
jgi:hypothetical protein